MNASAYGPWRGDYVPLSVKLAAAILDATIQVETYLEQHDIPSPSLKDGSGIPRGLPADVDANLRQALDGIDELQALLMGPLGWMSMQFYSTFNLASLQILQRYNIPAQIPAEDNTSISVADLAQQCNPQAAEPLARLIQHAASLHFLAQPQPGQVAHSALSRLLATTPALMDWIACFTEDMWPAAPRVVDAVQQWPNHSPANTAYNLATSSDVPFFQQLATQPNRARRFASTMSVLQSEPSWGPAAAIQKFDWGSLAPTEAATATVVDVGGADGAFAAALIKEYPRLDVIVQDLASVVAQGQAKRADCKAISFQAHDFFTPQLVLGAQVYLLRMILHNWPDEQAVRILQQLIPVMKPGVRVLINDHVVPAQDGLSKLQQREICYQDLLMMAIYNGKERSLEQWTNLVTKADPCFQVVSVSRLEPGPLALIEIMWREMEA